MNSGLVVVKCMKEVGETIVGETGGVTDGFHSKVGRYSIADIRNIGGVDMLSRAVSSLYAQQ